MTKPFTDEIEKKLLKFYNDTVGAEIMRGITYTLTLDTDSCNQEYLKLNGLLKDAGYEQYNLLKVSKLCNGYIFDMDLSLAKREAAKTLMLYDKKSIDLNTKSAINSYPNERIESEKVKLANYIIKEFEAGNSKLSIALYSRNQTGKIVYKVFVDNQPILMRYDAFALRKENLESINEKFLVVKGLKIAKIRACEILPTRTGAGFELYIEQIPDNIRIVK